jgi:hypothetical protein
MLVDHMGEAVLEHVNHMNSRTQVKMDDLRECLADVSTCCPDLIIYGLGKYCVHKDHIGVGARACLRVGDAS